MDDSVMERMWNSGHISADNASYVEDLYEKFLHDSSKVPDQWKSYFECLPEVEGAASADISHSTVRDHFLLLAKNQARVVPVSASSLKTKYQTSWFSFKGKSFRFNLDKCLTLSH